MNSRILRLKLLSPASDRRRGGFSPALGIGVLVGALLLMAAVDPSPAIQVAVIDSDRITAESVIVQEAIQAASPAAQALTEELRRLQTEIQSLAERFASQESVTSAEENQRRIAAIQQLTVEADALTVRLDRELALARELTVDPLRDKILRAINEVARERGIPLVLPLDNVIYFDPTIDLTSAVIARIDAS